MEKQLPKVTVDGKQMIKGRRKIVDRAMDVFESQDIDWNLYNLLITVTPKVPEGV